MTVCSFYRWVQWLIPGKGKNLFPEKAKDLAEVQSLNLLFSPRFHATAGTRNAARDHSLPFGSAPPAEYPGVLVLEADGGEKKVLQLLAPAQGQVCGFVEQIESAHFQRDGNEPIITLATGLVL